MSASSTLATEIKNLTKSFATFQLGPLDLSVPEGGIYGLIGPNGAGKTTTIDLIMGMGAANAGTVTIFGLDARRNEKAVKERIGYVSPDLSYNAWVKIGKLFGFQRQFYPTWDDEYCLELLRRFSMNLDDRITTLSLGNKTKLALVSALSHRPDLLILDEPTIGLDAVAKHQFYEEVLSLLQEENRTVLISSHSLSDLERYADYLGFIQNGKMILEGAATELLERYRVLDLRIANGFKPSMEMRVLRHDGDRWQVLADRTKDASISSAEVLSESSLTLEELFVALMREEAAR